MSTEMAEQQPSPGRREHILQAASDVFAERGIHKARIDDVAAAAGVSKGTIYWYFSSKDEIVFALVDAFFAHAHSGLVSLLDQPGSVTDRLRDYLRSYAATLEEHRHLAPLAMEFYALALRRQRVRDFLERYYTRWTEASTALLDQGKARGEFRVTDTWSAARTFVELFDGAFLIWAITTDRTDLSERMMTALDLFLHGIAPERDEA